MRGWMQGWTEVAAWKHWVIICFHNQHKKCLFCVYVCVFPGKNLFWHPFTHPSAQKPPKKMSGSNFYEIFGCHGIGKVQCDVTSWCSRCALWTLFYRGAAQQEICHDAAAYKRNLWWLQDKEAFFWLHSPQISLKKLFANLYFLFGQQNA